MMLPSTGGDFIRVSSTRSLKMVILSRHSWGSHAASRFPKFKVWNLLVVETNALEEFCTMTCWEQLGGDGGGAIQELNGEASMSTSSTSPSSLIEGRYGRR